jgi:hypothetical protein
MRTLFFCAALAVVPVSAHAQELRDLCPDRPGKGTSACTVDAGHFQLEVDAFDGAFQRVGGVTTDTYYVAAPNLKFGVTDSFDVEAGLAPLVSVRTHDAAGTENASGIGDLYLRGKFQLTAYDGGDFAASLEPFLKAPTAPAAIGNRAWEGGVVAPLALGLGDGWSLSMTPEVDMLADGSGGGHHAAIVNVLGVGRVVAPGLTLGAEVWESTDLDPAGTVQAASFDLDAAWLPTGLPDVQLDCGINLGLNRNAPGTQVYAGVSRRF